MVSKVLNFLNEIYRGAFFRGNAFSHTKLWSNTAYSLFTWAMYNKTLANTASDELWMIYIGTVAGHTLLSSALSKYKLGIKEKSPDEPQ